MTILKKFFVILLTLAFWFESSLVFAAKPKKKSARSGNTSGKTKAKSSKGGKGAGSKRAASTGAGKSSKRAGSRGAGGRRVAAFSTANKGSGASESASDSASVAVVTDKASQNCRTAYSECMDMQIAGILSKYKYLGDDEAVQVIQDSGDPLRCVYYYEYDKDANLKSSGKKSNGVGNADGKDIADQNKIQDVNSLYYGYNYYCKAEEGKTEAGVPVNKCVWTTASGTFATKGSYAFYKAAYDQLVSGELNILHFTETDLYKNKLQQYMGPDADLKQFSISGSDVSDMFASLGLDKGVIGGTEGKAVELFKVTVAPPAGAGTLSPAGVFRKAHDICMGDGTPETMSGLSATQLDTLKKQSKQLKRDECQELTDDLVKYYQTGLWTGKVCPEGYTKKGKGAKATCIGVGDNEGDEVDFEEGDVDTGFMSAKASCVSYEQALMSSRDQIYAKFQDQMTNYLNDNIAKLISKEAKNQKVMANSFNDLSKADTENKIAKMEAESEMRVRKVETEARLTEVEAQNKARLAEAAAQEAEARKKLVATLVEANGTKLKKRCEEGANNLTLAPGFLQELNKLQVCITTDGTVTSLVKEDGTVNTAKEACSGTALYCEDEVGIDMKAISEARTATIKYEDTNCTDITAGNSKSDGLEAGFYKLIVKGGKGGQGLSRIYNNSHTTRGGYGGNGDKKEEYFSIANAVKYTAVAGKQGRDIAKNETGARHSGWNWYCSDGANRDGGDGGTSSFKIEGVIDVVAEGGQGGESAPCSPGDPRFVSPPETRSNKGNGGGDGPGLVRICKGTVPKPKK